MAYNYNIFMTCALWYAEFIGDKNGKSKATYLVLAQNSSNILMLNIY